MLCTQSVVCVHLPSVISCSRYSYDCIPCTGANINTFQRYHFVPMGIEVDLPVNVKKAVTLEILTTVMEELKSQSMNLHTRKRLNAIPPAIVDGQHRVYGLRRQFQNLLRRKGALLPLPLQIILPDIPPWLAIQGLDCRFINVSLVMVI
jgi:hypothetical protein